MKKVTFLTAIALASVLASACTVTVGEKFDDDDSDFSDDPDFVDDSDFVDNADEDASDVDTDTDEETTDDDTTPTSTAPTTTSDAGQNTDTGDDESTTSVTPTTSEDPTSSAEPVNPVNPAPAECSAPGEPDSCAECLHLSCASEWAACCGEPNCVMIWNQITACVFDAMSDDPQVDVDNCSEAAAPDMEALNLSDAILNLRSCVETPFESGDEADELDRQPGDGTCTLPCYNALYTVAPE